MQPNPLNFPLAQLYHKAVNPADPRSGTGRRLLAEYNDFRNAVLALPPKSTTQDGENRRIGGTPPRMDRYGHSAGDGRNLDHAPRGLLAAAMQMLKKPGMIWTRLSAAGGVVVDAHSRSVPAVQSSAVVRRNVGHPVGLPQGGHFSGMANEPFQSDGKPVFLSVAIRAANSA
jgi:hypothetical protein